jgi:hypothetical protein
MENLIKNQSGSALVASVAFTAVFAVMSMSYLQIATSSANHEIVSAIDNKAFLASESGLMMGANWVTQQNPVPSQTETDIFSGSPIQTNGIDVRVDILVNAAGDISIQATTKNADLPYQKAISSQLRNTNPFTKAVFGDGGVEMTGNGYTDSYDSDAGPYNPVTAGSNGDVGTNGTGAGAVKLAGNATINGDASTGPGGTVTKSGNAKVNGGETHDNNVPLPPVTIPADLQALIGGGSFSKGGNWSGVLPGGNYKFTDIDIKANAALTITGDARIYLTDVQTNTFSISGNGKIVIAPGASLKIFSDGGCQIAGNGIANQNQKPEDFQFQSTFTSASNGIKTTGNGTLHGIIYAPNTKAMIAGNGDMYGSIVCDYVKISGNGNTHYDEALANKAIEGLKSYEFVAGSWVEKNIL